MGASKTIQYSSNQLQFARIANAIGHPARIAILQHLSHFGFSSNRGLVDVTQLSLPTIQQHLAELKKAELIEGFFIGRNHFYTLAKHSENHIEQLNLLFQKDQVIH